MNSVETPTSVNAIEYLLVPEAEGRAGVGACVPSSDKDWGKCCVHKYRREEAGERYTANGELINGHACKKVFNIKLQKLTKRSVCRKEVGLRLASFLQTQGPPWNLLGLCVHMEVSLL